MWDLRISQPGEPDCSMEYGHPAAIHIHEDEIIQAHS
ncbi:hypothetical protein J2T61_001647 [Methanocalculus sp. AMF5]|nr:hypothetical protein [Methanocalculus sp. AMF5]